MTIKLSRVLYICQTLCQDMKHLYISERLSTEEDFVLCYMNSMHGFLYHLSYNFLIITNVNSSIKSIFVLIFHFIPAVFCFMLLVLWLKSVKSKRHIQSWCLVCRDLTMIYLIHCIHIYPCFFMIWSHAAKKLSTLLSVFRKGIQKVCGTVFFNL